MRKFHFVDFAAHFQKGFRNHIVSVDQVPSLADSFGRYGCYATYFFFSDEILTYVTAQEAKDRPTVSGYAGKVWAPYFPVDLDHTDFGVSLQAARALVAFFRDRWQVDEKGLHIYFSGSKGFHLMLDSRLFGRVLPSKSLALVFAAIRRHLAECLPEPFRGTVDLSIRDRVRLLRLPNTVHEKSGLYKVWVKVEELFTFTPDKIFSLAKKERPLGLTDGTGYLSRVEVPASPEASKLYRRIWRQVRQMTRKPFEYHFRRPADVSQVSFSCAGIQKMWESHVDPGFRNNCAIRLASEFRLLGLAEDETRRKLYEWNEARDIGLPSHEIERVLHSGYQHPFPYRYGCRDDRIRHFCPLPSYDDCQAHLAAHATKG